MASLFKWLFRLATALVVLCLLAVAAVYYLASRSLPDYDKELAVRGIDGPVEIVRNNANVPHIFGAGDADVFFGLGYAHAQDRLWQMEFQRRLGAGRLAEMLSSLGLIEVAYRRLGFGTVALHWGVKAGQPN